MDVGAAIIGTDQVLRPMTTTPSTLPGYTVVNAFANYQFSPAAQLSVGVNNLFDELGYTEVEGDGHAARAVNGRTARITLKYQF